MDVSRAIGVGACAGGGIGKRQFETLGHTGKVIAPQIGKPVVKHQKDGQSDAEAICTALMLANMHFVPTRSEEQQDIQAVNRARRRLVNHRTPPVGQRRGLLLERGTPIVRSIGRVRRAIPERLEDQTDVRVVALDRRADAALKSNQDCRRIAGVCSVGPKMATVVAAAVGDSWAIKSSRHLAA